MKSRKRKAEKSRDSPDGKRGKLATRRGKGPLVPPPPPASKFNVDSPASDCGEPRVCPASSITIPVSQNGRRVSAPKRASDDSPQAESRCSKGLDAIPTPGYRLVDDGAEKVAEMVDAAEAESEGEEMETRSVESSPEYERPVTRRSMKSAGKAMYRGVLHKGRACSCSVLVVEFDRGWRETGATVEMFSGHRGWYICVLLQEETLFIQEIRRKYFNYTTNKVTGAYMWRAEQEWMLEFETYSQLSIFKKLYEKCFHKNQQAGASLQSPAPKFRVVKDLDPRWRGPAFIRPANEYIPDVDMDMDNRVLYDMDSEDENWLKELNGKAGTYKQKVSEHKFEKAMYLMEKYSYDRNELLSEKTASVLCLHVASLRIIKLVHGYWIDKRRRKGIPLVRHFQLEEGSTKSTSSAKSASCTPSEEEQSPGENNSLEEPTAKETTQPSGSDSPSLPEVCDAAPEEAESSRPKPTALVWKKFTGRASAEERKKLKIMNQLRQSGIKHFSRRGKQQKKAKSPESSSSETITVEEAARELYALADAAMQKQQSVPPVESSETESDIETLELARDKEKDKAPGAGPAAEQMTELEKEKQRLRQQMQILKQQMKMVDDEMNHSNKTRSLDELAAWSVEIESEFNEQQRRGNKQSKGVSSAAVSFKRIPRTSSRLVTV